MHLNKNIALLSGTLAILISGSIFVAQAQQPASNNTAAAGNSKGYYSLNQYYPLEVQDYRLDVEKVNFYKRFDTNGAGEFLDVGFDVVNNSATTMQLYGYVVAYYESNAVNDEARRLVPYPSWRSRDYDREARIVHYVSITPKDINENDIWNENDPDYISYMQLVSRMRNSFATNNAISFVRPPIWKYLAYINDRPTEGYKFPLYGIKGPDAAKGELSMDTNYVAPTEEERKKRNHPALHEHKYTVNFYPRKTMFQSHHFSPFRTNYQFFNKVVVVLYAAEPDPEVKGSKPNQLVFKRTFNVTDIQD